MSIECRSDDVTKHFFVIFLISSYSERTFKNTKYGENLTKIEQKFTEIWAFERRKNLHTFSVILLSVRIGTQIGEKVGYHLYIQWVISQLSFAQFTPNFHHNSYLLVYFLAVVINSGDSKKNVFCDATLEYSTCVRKTVIVW